MLQEKPDWETAKRVLGQPKFIERLLAYDADNVPDAVLEELQRVVQDVRFTPEQVIRLFTPCCSQIHAHHHCRWSALSALSIYC